MYLLGTLGINPLQLGVKCGVSVLGSVVHKRLPQGGIGQGLLKAASAQKAVQIKPRAAAKNGKRRARTDLTYRLLGKLDVLGTGKGRVGIQKIQKMMHNTVSFLKGRLVPESAHPKKAASSSRATPRALRIVPPRAPSSRAIVIASSA